MPSELIREKKDYSAFRRILWIVTFRAFDVAIHRILRKAEVKINPSISWLKPTALDKNKYIRKNLLQNYLTFNK